LIIFYIKNKELQLITTYKKFVINLFHIEKNSKLNSGIYMDLESKRFYLKANQVSYDNSNKEKILPMRIKNRLFPKNLSQSAAAKTGWRQEAKHRKENPVEYAE